MEQVTNNPGNAPVATVVSGTPQSHVYLSSRIRHLLDRADNEAHPKKRFALLENARDLARRLRRNEGESPWWSIGFAAFVAAALVGLAVVCWPKAYSYSYPDDYLRVVQNIDPCLSDGSCGYRFVMQAVVSGRAFPETEMHFCAKGLQPRFEAGHTLAWIRYINLGSCQSIDGYDVVRDSARSPILAPNCQPDYRLAPLAGHISCEGGRAKYE